MTNEACFKLMDIPAYCHRNRIVPTDGLAFGIGWAMKTIRYFNAEAAAASVTYSALVWLDCGWRNGELEVRRDGSHAVRLIH